MKHEIQFDIQLNTKSAKYNFIGLAIKIKQCNYTPQITKSET